MQSLKILDGANSVDAKISFQTPVTFTNSSDRNEDEKNPHFVDPKTGNTKLMSAVEHNNVEQITECIKNGASVNFYNNVTKKSCLKVAFDRRFITAMDLLLQNGAECNVYDYMDDIDRERLVVLLKHLQGKFVFPKRFFLNTFLLVMEYFQNHMDKVDLDSIWNIDCLSPIAVKQLFKQVPDYKISNDCFQKLNENNMRTLLKEVKSLSEEQVRHLSDKFPSLVVELYKENQLQLPPFNIKTLSLFLNDNSFEDYLYAFKEDLNQTFQYNRDPTQTLLGVYLCYGGQRVNNMCLLLVKCDLNQEFMHNNKWYTPLSYCCDSGRYDLVDMLLTCDTLEVNQDHFRTTSLCPLFILNKEEMHLNAHQRYTNHIVAVRDKLLKLGAHTHPKIADVDFITYMLPHEKYQDHHNHNYGRVNIETVKRYKYSLMSTLAGVLSIVGFVVMKKRLT